MLVSALSASYGYTVACAANVSSTAAHKAVVLSMRLVQHWHSAHMIESVSFVTHGHVMLVASRAAIAKTFWHWRKHCSPVIFSWILTALWRLLAVAEAHCRANIERELPVGSSGVQR